MQAPDASLDFVLPGVELGQTLGFVGPRNPTGTNLPGEAWRAFWTPAGPVTLRLTQRLDCFRAQAWGPGAEWAVTRSPELLGAGDSLEGFAPRHPVIRDLSRRYAGMRMGRTNRVFEALAPVILEQKVTTLAAMQSWYGIVRRWGRAAPPSPSPRPLLLPPAPDDLAATRYFDYHELGVEQKRAQTLILAARQAAVLEATLEGPVDRALARLQSIPGIGPWTAQQVAERAFGFADAVPTGDFHLPNEIAWVLAREPRGTDARMLQLLAPYAGHRGRVIRYIVAARIRAPKRGPRLALHDIRAS